MEHKDITKELLAVVDAVSRLIGRMEADDDVHRSRFKLVTQKNFENKIGLSGVTKKEDTDKSMIEVTTQIKGICIDKKPRPDGRWQARYKDEAGSWHSVYASSYDEAKDKVVKAKHGTAKTTKGLTVADWFNEWFSRYKEANISPDYARTIKAYINRISVSIGKNQLSKITVESVQDFLLSIELTNTREKIKTVINEAMEKAVALGKAKLNPIRHVEIKGHQEKHYPPIPISKQDSIYAGITDARIKRLFFFCCCTGLRIAEALGVEYADISDGWIAVNKQFDRHNQLKPYTKSRAGLRHVPAEPELIAEVGRGKGRVFEGLTYGIVKKYFSKFYADSSLELSVSHSMRHTFISMCYYSGIRDKYIQQWAGHSKIDTTLNVYTHILESGQSRLVSYFRKLASRFDTQNDTQK